MKIIGKLHDYYDGLMSYGQDDQLVFYRATESVGSESDIYKDLDKLLMIDAFKRSTWREYYHFPLKTIYTKDGHLHTIKTFFVGFCGKIYFGLHIDCGYNFDNPQRAREHYIYSLSQAERLDALYQYQSGRATVSFLTNIMRNVGDAVEKIDAFDLFVKHKVPYFVAHTERAELSKIDIVPELKKYNFQAVKDPYLAYQEISMFLGGVIPRQTPEMVQVSDKDRIAQHGFDKLSFRHPFKLKKVKQ